MPSDLEVEICDFCRALAFERGTVGVADGVVAIPLGRKRVGTFKGWALVSYEDRALGRHFWGLDNYGYPRRLFSGNGKTTPSVHVRMSREIMGLERYDELVVDHINRNKLDNRRENLRVITQGQNTQNQSPKGGKSRFRGVSLSSDGMWLAYGRADGRKQSIGRFRLEEEAGAAARAWRLENMPYAID